MIPSILRSDEFSCAKPPPPYEDDWWSFHSRSSSGASSILSDGSAIVEEAREAHSAAASTFSTGSLAGRRRGLRKAPAPLTLPPAAATLNANANIIHPAAPLVSPSFSVSTAASSEYPSLRTPSSTTSAYFYFDDALDSLEPPPSPSFPSSSSSSSSSSSGSGKGTAISRTLRRLASRTQLFFAKNSKEQQQQATIGIALPLPPPMLVIGTGVPEAGVVTQGLFPSSPTSPTWPSSPTSPLSSPPVSSEWFDANSEAGSVVDLDLELDDDEGEDQDDEFFDEFFDQEDEEEEEEDPLSPLPTSPSFARPIFDFSFGDSPNRARSDSAATITPTSYSYSESQQRRHAHLHKRSPHGTHRDNGTWNRCDGGEVIVELRMLK
ncbi:hypothetical protein FB45DRAFT_149104 [Roridomyces roridus]|uniref:Uncharacterized protein n=1 Tax=Roridomyces roridus TaxID=1738132 RepID=A0AAD7BG84_9AGAR|nr:hypothetical protein FB45DRAFT_149104 [Roridomyces roridus]